MIFRLAVEAVLGEVFVGVVVEGDGGTEGVDEEVAVAGADGAVAV